MGRVLIGLSVFLSAMAMSDDKTTGPGKCFAELGLAWTTDQKIALCAGARGLEPITCFKKASDVIWNSEIRIKLCSGAVDNTPVNCFREMTYLSGPSAEQKVALCKRR